MAYEVKNLLNNDDIEQLDQNGCMRVWVFGIPWYRGMEFWQ